MCQRGATCDTRLLHVSGLIYQMDERTSTFNRILKSHQERVLTMAQGTSPHELISGGQDGSILIWDLRTGKKLVRHRVHDSAITSVQTVGRLIFSGACL
jgi:WD40 repeat protein